jgi:L-histidine N-alpha-methyltransferase
MATPSNLAIQFRRDAQAAAPGMARDIQEGLTRRPKQLPCKYFYDERGSSLFERITTLPEYYLTRAEHALLGLHADELTERARPEEIVELGSGASDKIRLLIDASGNRGRLRRYVTVDFSGETVERAARTLALSYPELEVHAVVGDFEGNLERLPDGGRRLVVFLGSTIGNFPDAEAVEFLRKVRTLVDFRDTFLLGTDLVKERSVLEAAYNDGAGVTAEFNRNILHVINRRLRGDFDPRTFEHVAFFDEEQARIESYLRSTRLQTVRLEAVDLTVEFEAGELLWTEVSCKYTRASVERLLSAAGWRLERWFADPANTFALSLARPA